MPLGRALFPLWEMCVGQRIHMYWAVKFTLLSVGAKNPDGMVSSTYQVTMCYYNLVWKPLPSLLLHRMEYVFITASIIMSQHNMCQTITLWFITSIKCVHAISMSLAKLYQSTNVFLVHAHSFVYTIIYIYPTLRMYLHIYHHLNSSQLITDSFVTFLLI